MAAFLAVILLYVVVWWIFRRFFKWIFKSVEDSVQEAKTTRRIEQENRQRIVTEQNIRYFFDEMERRYSVKPKP